jgi:hypothetical protein
LKNYPTKVSIAALDKEVKIKSFAQFSSVTQNDELIAFAQKANFSWPVIIMGALSVIFYFVDGSMLALFSFNMFLLLLIFIWNYKYNFLKKPLLRISKAGITYRNSCYAWENIQGLVCAEEFDEDRRLFNSIYIKLNYNDSLKKIDISGLSKPAEEIIHYINSFQGSQEQEGTKELKF